MPFKNREEAANLLAQKLSHLKGENPLVLAIPRGAVPMAKIIAEKLEGEVDVVLVHKLGAPGNPELAIGSIDETGHVYLGDIAKALGISDDYIEEEKNAQIEMLKERRKLYTSIHKPISPTNRIVVVLDDGIATGSTMIAALHAVRAKNPSKLIAAIGVAPADNIPRIEGIADEVVCLEAPLVFYAVGQFYAEFGPVSDEEVKETLEHAVRKKA
ncbi:phosphoribosyltransferase [Bdellovibrionota bacterium]